MTEAEETSTSLQWQVMPSSSGEWDVRRDADSPAVASFQGKTVAIRYAKALARMHRCEVRICSEEGATTGLIDKS